MAASGPAGEVGADPERSGLRILVTGSRNWDNAELIRAALRQAAVGFEDLPKTVVHGHNPRGADAMADRAALELGWLVERHPADWEASCRDTCRPGHRRLRWDGVPYCPAAGNYRNQDMVNLGADLALAFSRDASHGTQDCVLRAVKAGIPVLRYARTQLPNQYEVTKL